MSQTLLAKIVIIGDSGSGKTAILDRVVHRTFTSQYKATIGSNFLTTTIIANDTAVTLQLWDTAGQERFQSLGNAFYRGADVAVVVFDVTVLASFRHVPRWAGEFGGTVGGAREHVPLILVGNKTDVGDRAVDEEEARAWALANGFVGYYETSAKTGAGVDAAFRAVATAVAEANPPSSSTRYQNASVDVLTGDDLGKPKEEAACCT
uniref:Uncharacterized protein n=1 Tax=Sexangularia sp. CB-2014 TaxID=1486929 RepID=A0A7S1YM28_9EUKA|mmetsp:Transcript_8976/g.28660  ORF Transcript_8976/g.28660 Transcript_8976/m.28660 type:complete len:207 (+) Transcript_8976:109-729(+)|eukprot:CAMPEP_0170747346 /NCGR_PEP_ID=MMETSP0437-20130122/9273_1 /TAXON_ID=0 /ORGANISM="Sexangularia sp." /LENGTH=206 /DNA_ID=CAMNT_0011086117 /DNA_START=96 /DNA_END=716 /DNA_ORIENTATION=-